MKLEKDTTISHYKILSEIGRGGMGEVYLAQDTKLNRQVAIKFLSEEFGQDSEKLNRFIQEAQATSALNHPNILTVYGIDNFENTHYIATEFIEGETLREVISRKETILLNQILKIAIQSSEALSAAHKAGIAHRDIKPENIMIRKDGYVKVLDFGLAKLTEKNRSEDEISLEGKTKALVKTNPGVVMGTVSYMSPEQAQGKETDERTDIWSLGVVLYEMLSGKVPFKGKTINHTLVSIMETEPKLLENVPDELQRIVRKTLTKDKAMRYQTSNDLAIDLKNLRRNLDIQGELERSIIPNKEEIAGTAGENETQVYAEKSIEETKSESGSLKTQNETQITNASSLEYAVTKAKSHKLGMAFVSLLLLGVISVGMYFAFFAGGDQINSIAVMPFVNESGDEDIEYLSDGMTETLIGSLTKIPGLSVMARSSVFFYKGKNTNPRQIGEELNVEAILLGRVTQRGDDLKISLELVDTKTLAAIWSETYDRKMSNLVSLQNEIARNVSDTLRLKLTTSEQEKVAGSGTENSEAQQFYMKGLFHFNKRIAGANVPPEIERSVRYYKQAIEKDPNYALAYAGLAASYSMMPRYTASSTRESLPKVKEAAQKALELDPDLAEAHASLGNILLYSYDWEGAERSYLKAIEVDPKYAKAYQWYGEFLANKRMYDEALKNIDKALELDPFDQNTILEKGSILFSAGKYDEAIIQTKKSIELFPEAPLTPWLLHRIYLAKGMEREAMEQFWITLKGLGGSEAGIQAFKESYKKGGVEGVRRKTLETLLANLKTRLEKGEPKEGFNGYGSYFIAYANLKDKEKTLEYLNKAYEVRDPYLVGLKRSRRYDFLKDEPEYQELLKKIGFPE